MKCYQLGKIFSSAIRPSPMSRSLRNRQLVKELPREVKGHHTHLEGNLETLCLCGFCFSAPVGVRGED